MRNLKTYKLDKLETLPKKLGMHKQYSNSFSKMENMWNCYREYHGDWIYPRKRAIIKGSVGKTKAEIVARMKLWWPKKYWTTPQAEVEGYMDFETKMIDGELMFTSESRCSEKQYLTLEEVIQESKEAKSYYWRRKGYTDQYYFDQNNVLCSIPSTRKADERMPRKEYYEKQKAKRKERRIREGNEQLLCNMTRSFMGNVDLYEAFTMLRKAWRAAQKSVDDNYTKLQASNKTGLWFGWYRHMSREYAKRLKLLTADMNAVNLGDFSVLDVYVKRIKAKREAEELQQQLQNAA